jgi:ankyrin repeat protein
MHADDAIPEEVDASVAASIVKHAGRPKLLAWLKDQHGVASLSQRQRIANSIQRGMKLGTIRPTQGDATPLVPGSPDAFIHAASTGNTDVLRSELQMLSLTAPPVDAKGCTALMAAAANGHEAVVVCLLQELRAEPAVGEWMNYQRHGDGATAVHVAAKNRQLSCLRKLLHDPRLDANALDHFGWSALMYACDMASSDVVSVLLDGGAAPSLGVHNGLSNVLTPLRLACIGGHAECVEMLLSARADLVCDDAPMAEDGSSMLLYAAQRSKSTGAPQAGDGHVRTIELLLNAKAAPDQILWDGITPLAYASMRGDVWSAELLLDAGAASSSRDVMGWTPLLWAALNGHVACARLLLSRHATVLEARPNGVDSMMLASHSGHEACVKLLLGHSAMTAAAEAPVNAQRSIAGSQLEGLPAVQCGPIRVRLPGGGLSHLDCWQERSCRSRPRQSNAGGRRPLYHCGSTHPHFANLLQLLLLEHGFERTRHMSDDWKLLWLAGQLDPALLRTFKPSCFVNKFPSSSCLTVKSQLWSITERMRSKHGDAAYGFVPRSFVLPEDARALQASEALDAAQGGAWIVKPIAACRGQGISIHRSGRLPAEVYAKPAIVSKYIDPPYLFDGRKVDLRLYVLVTSWRPLVVYLHAAGLARLASELYASADLSTTHAHLTNVSINKGHSEDSGYKQSLGAFREHLVRSLGEARASETWQAVDDTIVKCMLAAEAHMGQAVATYAPPNGARLFQMFGIDIMLDASGSPWLLEVNLDPSLAMDSPLDVDVKGTVLTDLLNLLGVGADGDAASTAAGGTTWGATEAQLVDAVNVEFARSQGGGWRRLHPSKLSAGGRYSRFFEPARVRVNSLPFDV